MATYYDIQTIRFNIKMAVVKYSTSSLCVVMLRHLYAIFRSSLKYPRVSRTIQINDINLHEDILHKTKPNNMSTQHEPVR